MSSPPQSDPRAENQDQLLTKGSVCRSIRPQLSMLMWKQYKTLRRSVERTWPKPSSNLWASRIIMINAKQ